MSSKLGYRLPDELWQKLAAVIPPRQNRHRLGGGRPPRADRDCAAALFFLLRTGCQWGALDETGICPHSTAHDRFVRWVKEGVWQRLWTEMVKQYDELAGIDWRYLSVDGSMGKAPLGGEKKRQKSD